MGEKKASDAATTMKKQFPDLRLVKSARIVRAVALKPRASAERIHQLRTEIRRANVTLRILKDWYPRRCAQWFRKRLGIVRDKAGTVRDLDVLKPFLVRLSKQLPNKARHWLLKRTTCLRVDALGSLRKFCQILVNRDFLKRSRKFERRAIKLITTTTTDLQSHLSIAIQKSARPFFSAVDLLADDRLQLHKVRILGRQLRYTLDLANQFILSTSIEATGEALSDLQNSLGTVIDQVSALKFLRERINECPSLQIELSLKQAIDSLETTLNDQIKIFIHETIVSANHIERLLEKQGFQRKPR